MTYIDRARALRGASDEIELTAARLLTLGEFSDEARRALQQFRALVKPDNRNAIEQADKIEDVLRERLKEGEKGHRRQRDQIVHAAAEGGELRISGLLRDLEGAPGSWQLYNQLVKELAVSGRFDEAIQWADRSVAQCLGRSEQINARGLAIEARGMKTLAEASPQAARLFAMGAHEPARKAIEALSEARELDYALRYLLGRCQLAGGLPDEARLNFQAASEICDRQIYRTVLRRLTSDIDQAYLAVARSSIDDALRDGDLEAALKQAVDVLSRLREPAAWLVDLGRVFYSAALNRIGSAGAPLALPKVEVAAEWSRQLSDALTQPRDVERALELAALATRIHPPSARAAQLLSERARMLRQQIAAVEALNDAGRLLADRRFDQLLVHCDKLDPAIAAEPRLIRMRVLALVGLDRFEQADAAIATIGENGTAEVRDFIASYPSLIFRRRIAVAQQCLKEANPQGANDVLSGARTTNPKEQAELDYCRAFAAALEGYALRRERRQADAQLRFRDGIMLLEPHLTQYGADARHFGELYDRLEKEAEVHGGR